MSSREAVHATSPHRNNEPLLQRSMAGASGGVALGVAAIWMAPVDGVVWTSFELAVIAAVGGLSGALLGIFGAFVVGTGGRARALTAGVLPTLPVLLIPWLPEEGRTLVQVPLPWLGLLLGGGLTALGVLRRWQEARWVPLGLVSTAWGTLVAIAGPAPPSSGAQGPDILLVTVDTTRADLVPGFGGALDPADMPTMAAFSAESVRFTQAFAPTALTGPSHASLLSGLSPHLHGVLANGRVLPPLLPWAPAVLQAAGWETQAFVSTAVLDGRLGFSRGFDRFDSRFRRRFKHGHPLLRVLERRTTGGAGFVRPDAETVSHAVSQGLTTTASGALFSWVHLYGPHWPYTPEPVHADALGVAPALSGATGPFPLNLKSDLTQDTITHAKALYRAELRTLDDQLARLIEAVGPDTVVVIVGDHGESLDEHGLLFNHGPLSSAPSTRVPLWIRAPGVPPGVVDSPVSIADVGASLLDLVGLPTGVPGQSLLSVRPDAVVVSMSSSEVFMDEVDAVGLPPLEGLDLGAFASLAVRSGNWSRVGSAWHPARWVYRPTDPRELSEGPAPPAPIAARLTAEWDALVARPAQPVAPIDDDQQAVLEALGYLEPR